MEKSNTRPPRFLRQEIESDRTIFKEFTVKAFVVTPKMTKNFITLRWGYDKGYKKFIADENLFVCILIYLYVS